MAYRSDFSGLVTNPRMKQVLSDCGHINSKSLGQNYTIGFKNYHGCCTSGPSTWYGRAGIRLSWWSCPYAPGHKKYHGGTPASVDEMKRNLSRSGLVPVWHGTGQDANAKLNNSSVLRPGDLASMLSSDSAHGAMWTGEDWRSDCIQGTEPYPYKSIGRGGDWTFILWRHPDLADAGVDIYDMKGLGNSMGDGGGVGGVGVWYYDVTGFSGEDEKIIKHISFIKQMLLKECYEGAGILL